MFHNLYGFHQWESHRSFKMIGDFQCPCDGSKSQFHSFNQLQPSQQPGVSKPLGLGAPGPCWSSEARGWCEAGRWTVEVVVFGLRYGWSFDGPFFGTMFFLKIWLILSGLHFFGPSFSQSFVRSFEQNRIGSVFGFSCSYQNIGTHSLGMSWWTLPYHQFIKLFFIMVNLLL